MPSFAEARVDAPSSIDLSNVYDMIACRDENGEPMQQPGKAVDMAPMHHQVPDKTLQHPFRPTGPVITSRYSYYSDTFSLDDPGLATSDCSTPAHVGYFSSAAAILRQEIVKRENAARASARDSVSEDELSSRPHSGSSIIDLSSVSLPSSKRSTAYVQAIPQSVQEAVVPSSRDGEHGLSLQPGHAVDDQMSMGRSPRQRSSSLSRLQFGFLVDVRTKRRSSLPELGQHQLNLANGVFQEENPSKDLALISQAKAVEPKSRSSSILDDNLEVAQATVASQNLEALDSSADASITSAQICKPNVFKRVAASIEKTYYPSESPPLIMPTGPTDAEKLTYLHTNRLGLYTFGVFSFLSLSAGMWLFVVTNPIFYWFGAVVALLQVYLIISYGVSVMGKDYDYKAHLQILEDHPIDASTCPTVDIYLPCCKEPIEILENTYKHVQELKWPENKIKVYVLDDGGSDAVHALATQYGFEYICREDRPRLKKAGNLRWADFCPRPDFLQEVIPVHLAKPDTAIVQTPQFFRTTTEQSWVEQGAGAVQELFYRIVQINRDRWGASICVGSNAVYRREALVDVGGTAEIGFSEDVHTGFYAVTRGWKVRYLPLCLACGICPDTPRAFFSQQMRWCMVSLLFPASSADQPHANNL
nr:putative cellulose synthase 2 [Quercus suber]